MLQLLTYCVISPHLWSLATTLLGDEGPTRCNMFLMRL